MQVSVSLPPRVGFLVPYRETPNLIWRDWEGCTKSGRLRLHTHGEQHVHSCSTNQESDTEKLYLLKLLQALAGCGKPNRERLSWKVESAESGPMAQCFSVGAIQTFIKEELRRGWARTLAHTCSVSANKETRVKVQFIPTESSCAGRTESGMGKGPWD